MLIYPTKATALNVVHPNGKRLVSEGVEWPDDGFTFRMLTQNIATEDKAKAYAPGAAPAPAPAPPSPANKAS